jgi:hypothetical protein
MSRYRRAFYYLRVLLLVSLFCGAYVLHRWSKEQDPRFFRFLGTPPGRLLARIFNWQALPMDQVVREKATHEMEPDELRTMLELERQMASLVPRHTIELDDGQRLTGTVIESTPERMLFRQGYGDSASVEMAFPRARVVRVEPSGHRVPRVTYRDIRFRMEFPEMNFYKVPPYTFMTGESYLSVVDAVEDLQILYRQFRKAFAPLIDQARLHDDLQVLSFGDERRFRAYQQQVAPGLEYTVGFYAPAVDRLVVFNQARADDVIAWQKVIATREAAYRQSAQDDDAEQRIREWRQRADRHIADLAEAQNRATLRHEAAHQLAFTFGVHSWHRAETEWLIEGLASYCETPNFGDLDSNRVRMLHHGFRTESLIPLRRLLNLRVGEFSGLEPPDRITAAYSESWSLVLFLMRPEHQDEFFEYMRYIRDPANLEIVRKMDTLDLLARFVGLSPAEIERRWKAFVLALPK